VSRKPSKKPKPRRSPRVFVASKGKAAIGQLESAILLWFNEADPVSILVLASNAHDCYHALGKEIGQPSWFQERLEQMPTSLRERMKYIQDFAKHGFMDLKESTPFDTILAEGLILVSIECHRKLFGNVTPLMMLFWARGFKDCPTWMPELNEVPQIIIQSGIIQYATRGTRKECLDRFQSNLQTLPLSSPELSRFRLIRWPF
jgi:hypothetical protein